MPKLDEKNNCLKSHVPRNGHRKVVPNSGRRAELVLLENDSFAQATLLLMFGAEKHEIQIQIQIY